MGGYGWISPPERWATANSGHFSTVGERLLILKAVIKKSYGNWQAPSQAGRTGDACSNGWFVRVIGRSFTTPLIRPREIPVSSLHRCQIAIQLGLATQARFDEAITKTLRVFPSLVGMVAKHYIDGRKLR